jgi:Ca-activated chloride channel family protein
MYVTFTHPEYLWYLLSVPLLVVSHFAFLKYTKRRALRFANFYALKKVSEQKILTKNHMVLIMRIFILTFLILAIAGTIIWYKGLTNNNDYVLAIDISASMTAQDFQPNRLQAAKDFSIDFIDKVTSDSKIGVVSFTGGAFIEEIPTTEFGKVQDTIRDLEIAHAGGTNIADAIVTSSNLLLNSDKGKTIILITDGSNTAAYFTKDPITAGINYAKRNSVTIYTIGLGSNVGPIGYLPEYYNVSAVYDESNLFRMANETGGKYYDAKDENELRAAYNDILSESQQAYIKIDLGPGLLILILAFIFIEWGMISTRFRSIP